jgi:hypothetical protein
VSGASIWTVCDDKGEVIKAEYVLPFVCKESCGLSAGDKSTGCMCENSGDCPAGYQFCYFVNEGDKKGVCTDYISMFTLDIGGETLNDADDKNIDPEDIYVEPVTSGASLSPRPSKLFDDKLLLLPKGELFDPPPVPDRTNPSPWSANILQDQPVDNLNINGIHINDALDYKDEIVSESRFGRYYSLNDDAPAPWYHSFDNIPLKVKPDHPKQWWDNDILDGEISFSIISINWKGAKVLPVKFENHVGLLPEPIKESQYDDDVNGLNFMLRASGSDYKKLYYTVSHEASYHWFSNASEPPAIIPLDPGDVYIYDATSNQIQFPPGVACDDSNLITGPADPDFDIDAIMLVQFPTEKDKTPIPGATGLGWLFSFAPDDPDTEADESGGNDPADIYWTPWSIYCNSGGIQPSEKRYWKVIEDVCTNDEKMPCLGLPAECDAKSGDILCDIDALSGVDIK